MLAPDDLKRIVRNHSIPHLIFFGILFAGIEEHVLTHVSQALQGTSKGMWSLIIQPSISKMQAPKLTCSSGGSLKLPTCTYAHMIAIIRSSCGVN